MGQRLHGRVTKLPLFGAFVQVATESRDWFTCESSAGRPWTPSDAVQVGDEVTVVVTEIDRERRRLALSRRQGSSEHR
ncbi:S1 RNA-binding domain-containing protein [Streptomyces sp. NPDC096538]|uniref:S1 RNA-binding domain-containing protein n=1 Tax=Streptomyces sp. NPDC096538 TaxID=3155427 RepID=UPI003325C739